MCHVCSTLRWKRMSQISIAFIEDRKELIIDVRENFEPDPALCSIYGVPGPLRKIKEEAYTPKLISIGPFHYDKDELANMEKQKIRYKREFVKRIGPEKLQQLTNFIEENEKRIRNSYEENSELDRIDFISMILYDAVFIIELFLRYYSRESDFLLNRFCLRETIWSDLWLLENQLPFFVLDGLYQLAFPNLCPENGDPSFISLSCVFFRHCDRGDIMAVGAEDILHFTDLSRYLMASRYPRKYPEGGERLKDLPCATKLQASGVRFNSIRGELLLDIRFEKKKLLGIPCLKVAELQIPQIEVDKHTESYLRNVMALEQCHYPGEPVVCNYIDLMDKLIDTDKDVKLLAEAGIIYSNLGEGTRIADMFSDLCLEIRFSESNYSGIIKALRDQYEKATLKRVYFSNLLRGTGTVSAVVLLVLTLIQTICSIMSVIS